MVFKRAATRYGDTPEPVTPYQKAAQVWDDRIGSARVQARNWRLMAFGCLALTMASSGALVWQAGQSTVQPYIVEVETSGAVRAVGPALTAFEPTDAQIAYHLSRFIEKVRGLSIDPVVVRENWLSAYDYATAQGALGLNAYARETDPFSDVGRRSVSVEVTSVVRASPDSFDIRWREQRFENGARTESARYSAILTLVIDPPRDEAALRANPLGIYVHAFDWSRDFLAEETP